LHPLSSFANMISRLHKAPQSIHKEENMTQHTLLEMAKLPGVKDLPPKVRLHFIKALLAEMEGNWLQAEFELNLAVAAEDAISKPAPVA
jgi:hypothetical protein